MKGPALQNKEVVVLRMAFRARKVFGTFEKQAPGFQVIGRMPLSISDTECPLTLWLNFNIASDEEYRQYTLFQNGGQ